MAKPYIYVQSHIFMYKAIYLCTKPYIYVQSHIFMYKAIYLCTKPYIYVQSHIFMYKAIYKDQKQIYKSCRGPSVRIYNGRDFNIEDVSFI